MSIGDDADCIVEKDAAMDYFNNERLSKNALEIHNKLDEVKLKVLEAKALKASSKNIYGSKGLSYKEVSSDELLKLTEERTRTFLNFKSLQAALHAAEANKAVTVALKLDGGEGKNLEAEEETYVRELLEEQQDLSNALMKEHEIGVQQEIEIMEARSEFAVLLFKYQQLRNQAGPLLYGSDQKDAYMKQLETETQNEDYRINQIRMMVQKLMMTEEKFGMIFDEETNERFKKMFYRCGMNPEEFRQDLLDQEESQ